MTSCSEIHGVFSMATSFPETWARTDVANTSLSRGLACACTRNVQCRCFAMPSANAKARQIANINRVFMPHYKDPRLRGLALDLQISPQTVKLSEVRQLGVKVTLANLSKRPVPLDFPTNQRIEIYLMNSAGDALAKWSDNHAITEKPSTILINPQERVEYNETIATRELTPNKVFIAEVFFPQYPELRIRQKFLAVP